MSTDEYRRALDAAIKEYEALGEQRRQIDERLSQLAHTIGTLNRLCGFVSNVQWGLTDACRVVLKNAGRPMTPTDVRDRLESIGFDLTKYTNSLAAVHTVLKRLNQSREVLFVELPSGKFACEWRPSLVPVTASERVLAERLASGQQPERWHPAMTLHAPPHQDDPESKQAGKPRARERRKKQVKR